MNEVLDVTEKQVLEHEGFRSKAYQDTKGIWTIGHGITNLTPDESRIVVRLKLEKIYHALSQKISFFDDLPESIQSVLINMAYQMGVDGLMGFQNTLKALELRDYNEAANEMLDSVWHNKDTPNRARHLAQIVRTHSRVIEV